MSNAIFAQNATLHKSVAGVFFLIYALLLPVNTFAQTLIGVTLSPPRIEDNVEPGKVVSYELKLTNQGDIEEVLYPSVYNMTGISREGQPIFDSKGDNSPYGLSGWITFEKDVITLAPRGTAVVKFTVNVPNNAAPGSHAGSVALTREAPKDIRQGTGVGYEMRSIISLRVAGEVVERSKVKEFFTDQIFYDHAEVVLTTTVINEGNVFARPRGLIDIKNMFGKKIETLPINDGGASVFPNSERSFTTPWKSEDFHIGKYTADMTLTVEGANGVTSLLSTIEFWIIPTRVVLPILGGLLFVLVIFWIMLRLYVARQVRRATGGRVSARAREATSLSRLSVVVIGLLIAIIIGLILLLFILG